MKNYQSFLSEQKEFLSEGAPKNVASTVALAGLGGGDGHDTVIRGSNVNILMPDMIYNWADLILNLPELSVTYNHQQLIAIFKEMSEREKRKVSGYINSIKNFKNKETIGMLAHSLKKAQEVTFTPGPYGKWGI